MELQRCALIDCVLDVSADRTAVMDGDERKMFRNNFFSDCGEVIKYVNAHVGTVCGSVAKWL